MRFKVDCVLERQDDAGNKNKRTPFILSSPHNYSARIGRPHRGDVNSIHVGSGTNIPDNFLVHVKKSKLSGKALLTQVPRWALS
nr:Gamma carbonic anhydrase 2, mitochondrial [Ipomoea batatas]